MAPLLASPAGWALLFALGLRHGLDPDHIAVIDGLSLRGTARRAGSARWTGVLFSAGHAVSFTAVALAAALVGGRIAPAPVLARGLDLLSVAVLLTLGGANLLALRRPGPYRPIGWKARWVRATPGAAWWAALALGVVFGAMFDTVAQAAALGTSIRRGGPAAVAFACAVFSCGMAATDGVDGFMLSRALQQSGAAGVDGYRRIVGVLVAALAFVVGGLELLSVTADVEVDPVWLTMIGAAAAGGALAISFLNGRLRPAGAR